MAPLGKPKRVRVVQPVKEPAPSKPVEVPVPVKVPATVV